LKVGWVSVMTDDSRVNRLLAHRGVDAYLHFCLYMLAAALIAFCFFALFVIGRVWFEAAPVPADPSHGVVCAVFVAVGVVIATVAGFLTVRRFRRSAG